MTWILLTNTTQLSTQHHAYKRVYTNYIYKPYIPHGSSPNITHTNITQLFTQDIQTSLNSSPKTYKYHSTLHPGHTNITQLFTQDIQISLNSSPRTSAAAMLSARARGLSSSILTMLSPSASLSAPTSTSRAFTAAAGTNPSCAVSSASETKTRAVTCLRHVSYMSVTCVTDKTRAVT